MSDAPDHKTSSSEPISPFLFVSKVYWIDLEAPDKLLKVSSSPPEMPTWRMPLPDRTRCGMSILTNDPFSEQKTCNMRTAYLPVFLVAQTSRPYYRFQTSAGRNTQLSQVLVDRPFRGEKARLEESRSLLRRNLDDVESEFAEYTAAMSRWRSEVRRWEVQTIRDEIEAGNTVIFRNRIIVRDLEGLEEWLRLEDQRESDGQYDAWYCGVLRPGHSNVFPPAHLMRSSLIRDNIESRTESLRTAVDALGELIKDLERKPVARPSCGPQSTPKPMISLPDCSSSEDNPEDEEFLAALTVWTYERHLHWMPRDAESRRKYKFKTEDDVYRFFHIKKLTSSDPTRTAGNNGLFQQHLRCPQDLARYPWGRPFALLEEACSVSDNCAELYTEEARAILRDMETEYFSDFQSFDSETDSSNWYPSPDLSGRIARWTKRLVDCPVSDSD
ncbi:hypothetical protein P170DRAFT_477137 [Aspergillus steynii IBT 23096]|uniref:Uncharacterized protein n=1 Tax=Aspergillus steynii IBT 23096 TaxID=1392250 RepID=A0A2I2G6M9_9EURO|nr:uncharacterized protein P170DRAFT_477137 [Aspergillus steynii IBT 23096]PLB48523.1 hypothetical protein P170DRAFT_477137 [Aspergillus steynii IBT 23096]